MSNVFSNKLVLLIAFKTNYFLYDIHTYTNNTFIQKFGVLHVFWRLFCSPRLHLFDHEYSINSNIVKYYYNSKELFSILIYLKCNLLLWLKLNFSIITAVFSATWSFRNQSNILIWCSRNISDYYSKYCAASYFCGNCFRILWWI